MIDLNSSRTQRQVASDAFASLVDAAIAAEPETPRAYLGASAIGDECTRRIQYDLLQAPRTPIEGRTRRIFRRGHILEATVAGWLRAAGFEIADVKPDGYPFGFSVANGRFRGHVDGVVMRGPEGLGLTYPCIWENKVLGAKGWRALEKNGVARAYPKYADQIAIYQAYLDLTSPALLTALCADDMELWYEAVPFDRHRAQTASDRAVRILQATDAREMLPRIAASADDYPCKWCGYAAHCWQDAAS